MSKTFTEELTNGSLDKDALRLAGITEQKGICIKSILTDISRDISYERDRISGYQKRLNEETDVDYLTDYVFNSECRIIALTRIYNEIAKLLQK